MQVNASINMAFPGQNNNLSSFVPTRAGRNGTLIAVVLDESGSMQSCKDATINGFNEFVAGQAAAQGAGEAFLTLVKFDAPRISTVYENVNIKSTPQLNSSTYTPNGGTNLLDAVGETMHKINRFLGSMNENQRPGVLVVIITDGAENSSHTYNNAAIKSMVAAAESDGDWTFTFLGANIDAFSAGAAFGMNAANTASYSTANMSATMEVLTKSTSAVRQAKSAGVSTQDLYASQAFYNSTDRSRMTGG